jgi:hypothetical protein
MPCSNNCAGPSCQTVVYPSVRVCVAYQPGALCPAACSSVQKDLKQCPLESSRALAPATHHRHLTMADCFSAVEEQALAAASIAQVGSSSAGSEATVCHRLDSASATVCHRLDSGSATRIPDSS